MPNAAPVRTLSLDVEHKGSTVIVHCKGSLAAGMGEPLNQRIRELLPDHKCIVLDLTDLKYVDSMGLGSLVRLYVSVKGAGGRLELVNLGKQIRELLGITNLLSLFGGMCEQGVTMKF